MNFTNFVLKDKKNLKKRIFFHSDLTYSQLYNFVYNSNFRKDLKYKSNLIAICLENPAEFIQIYFSIIQSRNTAIILEKGMPKRKFLKLLKKFNINQVITDDIVQLSELKNNELFRMNLINLNNKNVSSFIRIKKRKVRQTKSKDVSTVLFTSGTTGEKKGVMLTHDNLISNTSSVLKVLPIKKSDIVNLFLPNSYSFGLSILHTHLKKGSSFFFHNSPFVGSIIQELERYKCTVFYGVPSTFEILLNKTNFIEKKFPKLRFFAQAGRKLDKNYKIQLANKFKNKFYVMYGATEASPRLSIIEPKKLKEKIESIGRPLPGVTFKLFKYKNTNSYELGVKGRNIMKGYLSDKRLTKKSFKGKFYLTGDIVRKDKHNFYYILGRSDKIIKRFGYKININQIKTTIKKISFINKFKITFNDNEFILFVIVKNKFKNDINEIYIKKSLRESLASYEMPDKIIITKKFPLYLNQKNY